MTRRTTAPRRRPHVFIAGPYRDHRMRSLCGVGDCGQLAGATCHQMPDTDPAAAAEEARRLGEHPDREDDA